MREGCIYVLWINDKPYVGQSKVLDNNRLPTKRWKQHIADSKTPKLYLHRAIHKYGIQKQEVVEYICVDSNDEEELIYNLNTAEINWVQSLNSMIPEKGGIGYNHAPAGGGLPHEPHTEEHKLHMSAIMTGRKRTEECKQKIRETLTGKPLSDTIKQNMKKAAEKRFEQIFPIRLQEWVEQYKKMGSEPNSKSKDKDEKRAGQWHSDMVKKMKHNKLSTKFIDELNNTPGWYWEKDEFIIQFENWKIQKEKIGEESMRKLIKTDKNIKKAFIWETRIRELYRNKSEFLTVDKIKILSSCHLWSWELKRKKFYESVNLWSEFYKSNNRYPKRNKTNVNEASLFSWQSQMRQFYKLNKLSNDKIEKLNSIEGWKWAS